MSRLEVVCRAITYIEENLTEKLDLDAVADAVHYSKFHLHRLFTETVGLTPHDYIQRRQMTEAAGRLTGTDAPIRDIALAAGFDTQQAFTTAFTALYKLAPGRFRERGEWYPLQLAFALDGVALPARSGWTVRRAEAGDIPAWMDLARLAVDGFPHLEEGEHRAALGRYMAAGSAFVLRDGEAPAGLLLVYRAAGGIDFLAVHPLYRRGEAVRILLGRAVAELAGHPRISTTTYRAGDRADTGFRAELLALGFAEAELLTEFGYPTQRLVLGGDIYFPLDCGAVLGQDRGE